MPNYDTRLQVQRHDKLVRRARRASRYTCRALHAEHRHEEFARLLNAVECAAPVGKLIHGGQVLAGRAGNAHCSQRWRMNSAPAARGALIDLPPVKKAAEASKASAIASKPNPVLRVKLAQ